MATALAKARDDVVWFVANWWWTYEPRNAAKGWPTLIPLIPWPKQVEYLRWLDERWKQGENGLAEKTRDAGLTVLGCAWAVHKWLFVDGFSATFGSRKLELVDTRDNPDSIMEKCRIGIRALPAWMLPRDWNPKRNDSRCRITNPQRHSILSGEGGDEMGRGGRSSFYFIDEFASVPHAEMVDGAVSANAVTVIYVSTPKGMGNLFARKRFSGQYPVYTATWRDDPRKDDAWYEEQKRKYSPLVVATEVDLDYGAEGETVMIPSEWVKAATENTLVPWKSAQAGLDVASSKTGRTVIIIRNGPVITQVEARAGGSTTKSARWARGLAKNAGADVVQYDAIGVGAGVTGTIQDDIEKLEEEGKDDHQPQFIPLYSSESPNPIYYDDDPHRPALERFRNLRTEWWWGLRRRCEKTWEVKEGVKQHPSDELISIPFNEIELITQLSLPRLEYAEDGRIQVESKKRMKHRGVASPDFADACVYAFANAPDFEVAVAVF
jgi:hypothetical protein